MLASIELEARTADAIAETTHQRAHIGAIAHVVLEPVEMQDEIAPHAAHRVGEAAQDGAIGEHFHLQAVRLDPA